MLLPLLLITTLLTLAHGACNAYYPEKYLCPKNTWYEVDCVCQQNTPCKTPVNDPNPSDQPKSCTALPGGICRSSVADGTCVGSNCRRSLGACPIRGFDYLHPIPVGGPASGLVCLAQSQGFGFAITQVYSPTGIIPAGVQNAIFAAKAGLRVSLLHEVGFFFGSAESQVTQTINLLKKTYPRPSINTVWFAALKSGFIATASKRVAHLKDVLTAAKQMQTLILDDPNKKKICTNIGIMTTRAFWEQSMGNSTAFKDYPLFYADGPMGTAAMSAIDWGVTDLPFGGWQDKQVWVKQWAIGQDPEVCGENGPLDFLSARNINSV